jgi:hypothetical protein
MTSQLAVVPAVLPTTTNNFLQKLCRFYDMYEELKKQQNMPEISESEIRNATNQHSLLSPRARVRRVRTQR